MAPVFWFGTEFPRTEPKTAIVTISAPSKWLAPILKVMPFGILTCFVTLSVGATNKRFPCLREGFSFMVTPPVAAGELRCERQNHERSWDPHACQRLHGWI
jgi:hypothetical protein